MTAVNAPAIRELAEKGYCIHRISALTGVKLETVRGILRASNQIGQYDHALHLSPTKREPSSSPLFSADYTSLEQRAIGHLVLNKSQDEALAIAANFLTLDCIEFLEQYAEDVENNPIDHAAYQSVISSIFLI